MLTVEILKSLLSYDQRSGHFTWVNPPSPSKVKVGQRAGCASTDRYRCITINRKIHKEHRLVWLYMTGEWPSQIDHINRDRGDNRFCNLRLATYSQNMANRGAHNKYGFKGVSPNPRCKTNPWRSSIETREGGKRKFTSLGVYKTKEEAHSAYLSALREIHPEYASS